MKKYAFLALSVLGPFALSMEDNRRSFSVYPDSAEDLPAPQQESLNEHRPSSLSEISLIEGFSADESPTASSAKLHLDAPETSRQEVVHSSSDSAPASQKKEFSASSDISLLSTTSSDSPRSSQDSSFAGTSENEKISSDPDMRLSTSSDSTGEQETLPLQQTALVPYTNSQEVPVKGKRASRIRRMDPSSDSCRVPYVEEPSENTSSNPGILCSTNGRNDAIGTQLFQQFQTFLNPLLSDRRAAQPVVVVVNTNPPAPQSASQESVVQKTPEVSTYEEASIVSANHKDTLEWINSNPDPVTVQRVEITTGSLLSFGGKGTVSNTIRRFTKDPNFLGLSHVGMAIIASANEALALIEESARVGGLYFFKDQTEQAKEDMIKTIRHTFHKKMDEPDVFCIQSTGGMGVHIVPLHVLIDMYEGSIFVRRLINPLPLRELTPLLAREIGKGYNFNINQLARCARDSNKTEQNSKTFCSQLVAILYRDAGLLPPDIQANNVSPAEFDSRSSHDLLRELADGEKVLKLLIAYKGGCCGCY